MPYGILMLENQLFFFGNSITGPLAQSVNWALSPLGEPKDWPVCLKLILGVMYENKPPVSLFWGTDHTYFYNDGYIPIVGAAKHPWALGKKGSEVWSEAWDILVPQINQVLRDEGATWNEDQYLPIRGDDGRPRDAFFTYSYSPVYEPDGKINDVLVTCTETTGRVVAEKKLRQSQQSLQLAPSSAKMGTWEVNLISSYVSLSEETREIFGFSKEFDTTDAAVDDFIHPDDRLQAKNVLKTAIESGRPYDDIYRIVRPDGEIRWVNSKGQARYDYNGLPVQLVGVTFDLTEKKVSQEALKLVLDVINRLSEQFIKAGYAIPEVQKVADATGCWDRMRLEQIVTNLLTNAIKYGNQKPISIRIKANQSDVTFEVEDRGIGIPDHFLRKIFDRFERAVNANDISGLGLGLYITKQIIQAFRGNISVISTPGKDSTFTATLPKSTVS